MAQIIKENEVSFLVECFSKISDPRIQGRSRHLLIDVIVTTVCAVLCGARTCTDFEDFSRSRVDWLKTFLNLPNGIPSHDTYRRVLTIIDPVQLESAFREWVSSIKEKMQSKTISIDGKSIGGSPNGGIAGRSSLHVVNAFCHESGLSLGQIESNGSGGETTAALEMLDYMDIKDTLVLADAKFAVNKMVNKIRDKQGHYLVALKENNRFYRDRVIAEFESSIGIESVEKTIDIGHSRMEIRSCKVIKASTKRLDEKFFSQWVDLRTLIKVERSRTLEDKRPFLQIRDEENGKVQHIRNNNAGINSEKIMRTTVETTYYLSSKKLNATEALGEVRKHWGIENKLHWVLDVAFGEDDWLARAKRLSRNLASIRKIGLNLIRSHRSLDKKSIRRQMNIAGWNPQALEHLIFRG